MINNTSAKLISKVTGQKDKKKSNEMSVDIGIASINDALGSAGANNNGSVSAGVNGEKSVEDSFERYYNKDLDLDEGTLNNCNFFQIKYRS